MVEVATGELNIPQNFYLPHHCVLKEDSSTTKLRVVCDAKTSGFSWNDCTLVGPKLLGQKIEFFRMTRVTYAVASLSSFIPFDLYQSVETLKQLPKRTKNTSA